MLQDQKAKNTDALRDHKRQCSELRTQVGELVGHTKQLERQLVCECDDGVGGLCLPNPEAREEAGAQETLGNTVTNTDIEELGAGLPISFMGELLSFSVEAGSHHVFALSLLWNWLHAHTI